MQQIHRASGVTGLPSVASAGTATPTLHLHGSAMALLYIPTGWTGGTTFTWQASGDDASNFETITKEDGTDVTSTVVADRWCLIPPEVLVAEKARATFTATSREETGLKLATKG